MANCANTSVGEVPFMDGVGLYPSGKNTPTDAYMTQLLAAISLIEPLDINGNPDVNGRIGLVSVGVSNTNAEFGVFQTKVAATQNIHPKLYTVNGAAGGQDIDAITIEPNATTYWTTVLEEGGHPPVTILDYDQVQVVWFKQTKAGPNLSITPETHADQMVSKYITALNYIKTYFPKIKIVYMSSRIYAGYADTDLSPEKYAYWEAKTIRTLVGRFQDGDPGVAGLPLVMWGPYLWANGLIPRSDGLVWECGDYQSDGTHPNGLGQDKVANMLLDFFRYNKTACPWFLDDPCTNQESGITPTGLLTNLQVAVTPITPLGSVSPSGVLELKALTPAHFEYFRYNEILPFVRSKASPRDLAYFDSGEVYQGMTPAVLVQDVSGSVTFAGSLAVEVQPIVTGSINPSGVLTTQVISSGPSLVSMTGSISPTGTLVTSLIRGMSTSGSVTPSGSLKLSIKRPHTDNYMPVPDEDVPTDLPTSRIRLVPSK